MADAVLQRRRALLKELQVEQLLEGFAAAVTEKGYAAATIADVARAARTSKSTFYEHFADKEAAYLRLHALVAAAVEDAFTGAWAASADERDWRVRVRALAAAYLGRMAADPRHLAQVRIEPSVATAAAHRVRAEAGMRFAALLGSWFAELDAASPAVSSPPDRVVLAALAGMVALVAAASEEGPAAVLALEDDVTELFTRLLTAPGG